MCVCVRACVRAWVGASVLTCMHACRKQEVGGGRLILKIGRKWEVGLRNRCEA